MKTMFSDEVVQATELKRNQRYWFDRARQIGGITIMQGKTADLVLTLRKAIAQNTQTGYYAKQISQFFLEMIKANYDLKESIVFPWLKDMDKEDRQEFCRELTETFAECLTKEKWDALEELLEDWEATAETNRNPEAVEAWQTRGHQEEYVPLEAPDAV